MLDVYETHKDSFTISINSTVVNEDIGIELCKLDLAKTNELENILVECIENVVRNFLKKEEKC